jgi:hypothetical protein
MTAQLTPRAQAVIDDSDEYTAPIFRARLGAMTDEQIDAALEAWFANGPVGIEHKTDRLRMRAAIAAAAATGEAS